MDIHSVRQLVRRKSIYEIPLRVTFYARVSSESDEQLNSLDNQISYYEDFIRKNPAWTFLPGYVDEGISGMSTEKRENFHRMIDDAQTGLFDLIITKEISRFARNTLDSIQFTRALLNAGVAVFFQNDNINTLDEDSELRLSIMSSIAQEELRKLSSRIKFGHQQAIKKDVVLGTNNLFGYDKSQGRLTIKEEEAEMVRELYRLYSTGQYSLKQIENIFWERGYRNHKGKRIVHSTMSNIIQNPKYKGYYVGNKVKIVDMFTRKQKFLPPEEWVMHKDETGLIVPAIIDEETWEKANQILQRRSSDVKNRQGICNHDNLLTGKLFCTHCGTPYYRKESKSKDGYVNSKWVCSGKIKAGADSCPSLPLYEDELRPLLLEIFRDTQADTEALVDQYTQMYQELSQSGNLTRQIAKQKQIIDLANQKKGKLLEYNVSGKITDRDFLSMTEQCNQDLQKAEAELAELENQVRSNEEFREHMETVKSALLAAQSSAAAGVITREFVEQYIDRIFVTAEEDGQIRLEIRIFTGESAEKYLTKLRGRTGHMSKKMIEAYEQGIQ